MCSIILIIGHIQRGEMLADEELNEIKERAELATPGPWRPFNTDDLVEMNIYGVTTGAELWTDYPESSNGHADVVALTMLQTPRYACHKASKWAEDAQFIAHARTDIPALLAEVAELKRQLADYAAALKFMAEMPHDAILAFSRCQNLARATLKKWQPAPASPSAQEDAR